MTETFEPGVLKTPKARRKVKISDIVIFAIIIAVIVVLAATLIGKLQLKQDVSAAQVVSDKVIADIQKRDGTAARKLGTSKFQSTYTNDQLTKQFKAIEVATSKAPTLDRTIAATGDKKTVFFIYKCSALKVPYYVRTAVSEESGAWKLTNISGNADESKLIVQ